MSGSGSGNGDPRLAGGVVSVSGAALAGIHLLHAAEEFSEALPAVVYGVVLPLAVSLVVLAWGYWIGRRDWTDVTPWRIVGWFGGGVAVGTALIGLLIRYQAAERVGLSDPLFVVGMFGTYGGAVGLLVGHYDVQRQAQRVREERKARRLDGFASIVSHDLRNPLNVAEGHLELAHEECDSDHLAAVARSHDRMGALIEDLLTLARSGEEVSSPEPVALSGLVETCWRNVDTGDATLVTATDSVIRADRSRLQQLLENLVRNAVEHGGEGVTVTVGDLDDGFYVEDDGPGIPDGERDEVFESGYSTADRGTGLGLDIARRIADAHGWEIAATGGEDGGARFELRGVEVAE